MRCSLYCLILILSIAAIEVPAHAQSTADFGYTTVYTFGGSGATPSEPAGVIQATDGNFHSALVNGGTSGPDGGFISLTPAGAPTIVNFSATLDNPIGTPVQAADGNFYGVAESESDNDSGSIYQITPSGSVKTIYTQCPNAETCANGILSNSLTLGTDGELYGTTFDVEAGEGGIIYKVSTSGTFTPLAPLPSSATNYFPLLQASDGNWYGVSETGGANSGGFVFQYTTAGKVNVLYSFCAKQSGGFCLDGKQPIGGLSEGPGGVFYGVTYLGGTGQAGSPDQEAGGTLFSLTLAGKLTTLYNFCSIVSGTSCNDGASPSGAPLLGSDGNLYGLTGYYGADNAQGVAYQFLLSSDTYALMHTFCSSPGNTGSCGTPDFAQPGGSLLQANDGTYWGTSAIYCSANICNPGGFYKFTDLKGQSSPVQLTPSANISTGSTFTITYAVSNAYSKTLGYCIATNTAGDPSWSGILDVTTASQTITLTAPKTAAVYTYALTCGGGREMNYLNLDVKNSNLIATSTIFSASPNPATPGNKITLRAAVTPASGSGHPSGNVNFYYGSTLLGAGGLSNNVAVFTASSAGLPTGSYTITAKYAGDSTYGASSGSGPVTLAPATTTTLNITPTSVTPPANVTITINVSKVTGSGEPTGTVTLSAEGVALGTVSLVNGSVSFPYSSQGRAAGTYPVIATYNGDANDAQSVSNTVNVTVK